MKGLWELNRKTEDNEGLIRPMKGKTDPDVGPDAILVMIRSELEYLVKVSKNVASFNMGFFNLYQSKSDKKIFSTLIGPFLGAPRAGPERRAHLEGSHGIWRFGAADVGDLVSDEGPAKFRSGGRGTHHHAPVALGGVRAWSMPTSDGSLTPWSARPVNSSRPGRSGSGPLSCLASL